MGPRPDFASLRDLLGPDQVELDVPRQYLDDAARLGLRAEADALVRPISAEGVAATMAWCYEHEVPLTPRGGGSGLAGGAVPTAGGVVLSLENLRGVRGFDPGAWRIEVEAGMTTAHLRRIVRESGLFFPPDPGAAEDSQIGGNVATNAGGPHAFKYGVTGDWVTGLEVVLPPGRLVRLGAGLRKDVAGLDLKRLLIGSEGILGVITAVYLKLLPAPEASRAIVGAYGTVEEGCAALEAVVASGLVPATLDFIEGPALAAVASRFPGELPDGAAFLVLAEADGVPGEVGREAEEIAEALGETALAVEGNMDPAALWAWRDGVSGAVAAQLGAKVSEDVAVPLGALAALIEATHAIGRDHGLPSCSWGHGGDGNSHASFLLDPADTAARARAEAAIGDLFDTAIELGGSISGEHGVGYAKRDYLRASVGPESVALQRQIKRLFDPKGLLNPGKAIPIDE